MATMNPFDLLDGDAEDPSMFIAVQQNKQATAVAAAPKKAPAKAQAQPAKPVAKLPSKPLPPSEAGNFDYTLLSFVYFLIVLSSSN